jgi:hypothetical protein
VIAWLNPGAFAALALVAVPILIHLLLRRRAPRVRFPSVRFLAVSDQSAVRMRVPADLWLLLVRVAIVACAALAVARPLLLTSAREAAWAQRTSRAIVVDTSDSVNGAVAAEAAEAEKQAVETVRSFDAVDLREGVRRAAAWLATSPPARREIVVISDFQRGALTAPDLASLPDDVGVRMVRVTGVELSRRFEGDAVLRGSAAVIPSVEAGAGATTVTFRDASVPALRVDAPPEIAARLTRAVSEAGALAPGERQPPIRLPAGVQPDSLEAAAFVQASLNARRDTAAWAEREPERLSASDVQRWNRAPSPPPADAWRQGDESDARWFWFAALVLMLGEALLRRARTAEAPATEDARAA